MRTRLRFRSTRRRRLRRISFGEYLEPRQLLAVITVDTRSGENVRDDLLSLSEAADISNGTLAVSDLSPTEKVLVTGALSTPNIIQFDLLAGAAVTIPVQFDKPVIIDGSNQAEVVIGNGIVINAPDCQILGMTIVNGTGGFAGSITIKPAGTNCLIRDTTFTSSLDIQATGCQVESSVGNYIAVNADRCTITATTIIGSDVYGIDIKSDNNQIIGCSIGVGTDPSGRLSGKNAKGGILIRGSNNLIGGPNPGDGNIISNNLGDGVHIEGSCTNNTLYRNLIGLDATGMAAAGNAGWGVSVTLGASGTNIGDVATGTGNFISANSLGGILIDGTPSSGSPAGQNRVMGNRIGLDAKGTHVLPNNGNGLQILNSSANTIGSAFAAAGNVISGNKGYGILIWATDAAEANSSNNIVYNNLVGTMADGNNALGNTKAGIYIYQASKNTIGGVNKGNVISGNATFGVDIVGRGGANKSPGEQNVVQNNTIGLSIDQKKALGNGADGVVIYSANGNTVRGNVIGANANSGVRILGADDGIATGNALVSNTIGAGANGALFGNGADGVLIDGVSGNTVGGATAELGNIIIDNVDGVVISRVGAGTRGYFNPILSNSIFGNVRGETKENPGLGIRLTNGGNNDQPAPFISTADASGISGSVTGPPNTTVTLQFFTNAPRPDKNIQGQTQLDPTTAFTVDLPESGRRDFTFPVAGIVSGQLVTATTTDQLGNTSPFSAAATAAVPGLIVHRFAATEGNAVPASTLIATYTNPDPTVDSSFFTATINWGDGKSSEATLTQTGGAGSPYEIRAGHLYYEEGGYPVTVVVHNNVRQVDTRGNVNISRLPGPQSEGTIAVDPTNANRLFASSNDNRGNPGVFAAYSTDAGATWKTRTLGTGSGPTGDGLPIAASDPVAVFDDYGNLFLTYIDSARTTVEILLSTDGGKTFRVLAGVRVRANPSGIHQTAIKIGPGANGAGGSVWVSFQGSCTRIATVAASVTGLGQVGSFGAIQEVAGSTNGDYGDVAIGPNGQAIVTWQTNPDGPEAATIYASLDADGLGPGGWGPLIRVAGTGVGGSYPIPPQATRMIDSEPRSAWDRGGGKYNGRLYLSYTDSPGAASPNTDIKLVHSDDNGATWSAPVLINDDGGPNSQFLPSIAVDQSTGNLAVCFDDARNDPDGILTEFYGALSNDGGKTFLPNVLLSNGPTNATDSKLSPAAQANQLGDYTTTTFANGVFYPIWTDNSTLLGGNPDLPNFDMATQRVMVVQVADAELTATGGDAITVQAGKPILDAEVATFTDANPFSDLSDFSATIDWGDGTAPTAATISGSGTYHVTASHTYSKMGTYFTIVTILDVGGSKALTGQKVTVTPDDGLPPAPGAPVLDAEDDTGASDSDGVTNHTGTTALPLHLSVSGVEPPTAFVWIYSVGAGAPIRLGSQPLVAVDGYAAFHIDVPGGLADGVYKLAATAALSPTGQEGPMSAIGTFVIQTHTEITATNPSNGASVSALPGGDFTLTFSHALAGLANGGPALGANNPAALVLSRAGGAAIAISTTYHAGAGGTSSITLRPLVALAAGDYVVRVDAKAFSDVAGNPIAPPTQSFAFTIATAPPKIDPIAAIVAAPGRLSAVAISVTDPVPNRRLTFSLLSAPSGVVIDANTGVVTWTPASSQSGLSGTITVGVVVANNPSLADSRAFGFSVLVTPQVTRVVVVQARKKGKLLGAGSIQVFFNEPMSASAAAAGQYALVSQKRIRRRGKFVTKNVPVGFAASYNPLAQVATLKLLKPTKSPLQFTVRGSLTGANGLMLAAEYSKRLQ